MKSLLKFCLAVLVSMVLMPSWTFAYAGEPLEEAVTKEGCENEEFEGENEEKPESSDSSELGSGSEFDSDESDLSDNPTDEAPLFSDESSDETIIEPIEEGGSEFDISKQEQTIAKVSELSEPLQIIEDGWYVISTKLNTNFALDVAGADKYSDAANIQVWEKNYSVYQVFKITQIEEGLYSIISAYSGKALDVCGAEKAEGANVFQWEYLKEKNQQWYIRGDGEGGFYLIDSNSGNYLDVASAYAKNGQNVWSWSSYENNIAQKWSFESVEEPIMPRSIDDGVYTIVSNMNNQQVLEVSGGNVGNGANVGLWSYNGQSCQKWRVEYDSSTGSYTLSALCSGRLLNACGSGEVNGTNIWVWNNVSSSDEKWALKYAGDGTYYLINKTNGLSLDIAGASQANGANAWCWTQIAGANQQRWRFETTVDVADGVYTIDSALASGISLDVSGCGYDNGSNVQIWQSNMGIAQRFRVISTRDGYCKIQALFSSKYLDVEGGKVSNGSNVWTWTGLDVENQRWRIGDNGDGTYSIIAKSSGLYLDVAGSSNQWGTNVWTWKPNGEACQKWKFNWRGETIENYSQRLAVFRTYSTNTYNGTYNMQRALRSFNELVVWPGQTVAFFDIAGPCGAAEGYLPAGVVGGLGYGGGICQASTTLYGAVIRSGLAIVERHNHTVPSTYVPIGLDAMVNYGTADFCFRNSLSSPVEFYVSCFDNVLQVEVFGIQPEWYDSIEPQSWYTSSNTAAAVRNYFKSERIVYSEGLQGSAY